jgi:hypothetical protein
MDLRACDFFTGGRKYVSIGKTPFMRMSQFFALSSQASCVVSIRQDNEKAEEEENQVRSVKTVA